MDPQLRSRKPTYQALWSPYTGKYRASSSERPTFTVVDVDPFKALADLRTVLQLLS